ncbi:cyclic peptide export ABC transporter [Chitinophaga nivalis]|uniref:Cyclic peptide export ABC transporter n=1 Tax=Chitinophaga nivalis TaxID=2991709 RepID=A0ABT3IKB4_9BACT|nr:cyclic peptide export ABC transporter [Chitinophaga nivalis]MCW3465946.1 cyclic peptide export ABC transporter [Chitinophaga nivalis]MCW3484363.1 cyclic peptide export ABC transporter [Chitinophaga nivalis]
MQRVLKLILPLAGKWKLGMNILLGIISGLCNFLFIHLVTRIIGEIATGQYTVISQQYLFIFALIILFFIWTRRTLSYSIIQLSQLLFWSLRKQILSQVLQADYRQLTDRKHKIYAALVHDVNVLTQTSLNIIDFFTASILVFSCLVYLGFISWILFLATLGVGIAGTAIYHLRTRKNLQQFAHARDLENKFLEHFDTILKGFKEIYMEPKKGKAVYEGKILGIADETCRDNTVAFTGFLNNQIVGRVLFYILVTVILLVFSVTLNIGTGKVVSFVFTLLYLLGSLEIMMSLLPTLARAKIAANHLVDLKEELEAARFSNPMAKQYISKAAFDQITVTDLTFHYSEAAGTFGIGPINFNARKGEAVFIYGGNGSGKTTFLHTVLGIHLPTAGEIRLNDALVNEDNYADYKTAFAVVFSDFYLFNELHGVDKVDEEKWTRYLRLFELEGKVTLEGTRFSTTALSAGQRKRLALIAALMEDKPVLVLDEWAADQDPYFRKRFYKEILPALKQEGITIIAITHDDKYYTCADKLYKMDGGKLMAEAVNMHESGFVA